MIHTYNLSLLLKISSKRLLVNFTRLTDLLQGVALHYLHCIQREGARFVGANVRYSSHCLTRLQSSNEVAMFQHNLATKAEGDCYGERKSFRDGAHDNADRDDEGLEQILPESVVETQF